MADFQHKKNEGDPVTRIALGKISCRWWADFAPSMPALASPTSSAVLANTTLAPSFERGLHLLDPALLRAGRIRGDDRGVGSVSLSTTAADALSRLR